MRGIEEVAPYNKAPKDLHVVSLTQRGKGDRVSGG